MNLYVGNLPHATSEAELKTLFEQFGEVKSAKIVKDWDTGRSRGFGFVEMADHAAGAQAIEKLDGSEVGGRKVVVNEARQRPAGGGNGGNGGGGRTGGGPRRRF